MGEAEGAALAPLDDDEDVCRLCFSASIPIVDDKFPNQIDPATGLIRLEEISHRQIKRGFSMQRHALYSIAEAHLLVEEREARKRAKGIVADYMLAGILMARVGGIHGITKGDGSQIFQVLPKPLEGQPGHAEIHFKNQVRKEDFLEGRLDLARTLGPLADARELDRAA
ncbi:hypothetical protein [Xanthomonas arboricola]|uniref:hypothetical protein n=1 Tax=Xanthomonas arboricola TaxID=56448 RepID=UPI0011AF87A5|nr:hypothetical protein [Xanthomonas arboricola]